MPTAFLQPDSRLLRACEESTVLTSNERLRRELVRAYDAHQQTSGRRAWGSASVYSFEGHLTEQYNLLRGLQPEIPQLLSPEEELLVFEQLAPADAAELSPTAVQAWNLLHAWDIPLSAAAFGHTDNGRVFLAWAERVRAHLAGSWVLTRAELPGFLAGQRGIPSSALVCLGFESLTNAAGRYFAALESRGIRVDFSSARMTKPRQVTRCELPNTAAELTAVAQWCREILESSPDANVGVVVPDLTRRYHAVVRQFGAELLEFARPDAASTFDVAAGLSLAEQPIWRAARNFLELCTGGLRFDAVRHLLASRYLDLPGPLNVTPELPTELTLWQLAAHTGQPLYDALNRRCPAPDQRDEFSAWLAHFSALLQAVGWTGAGAGSGQYQAWEQLQGAMQRAAAGRTTSFPCTASVALSLLQQMLEARLFAPRTAAAPVQVMGYLETTGLSFTHLWVTGMQDTAWPAPVNPNPFIPLSSQRRHALPRIDQRTELVFAQARLDHWLGCSDRIVFSHAVDDGEARHLASPLTESIPVVAVQTLVKRWRSRSHPFFVPRRGLLRLFEDDHGTPLAAGRQRGGSGLLRDQAACPFRAWAIHRLGLRDARQPHAFPDAVDRGNLVHDALHRMVQAPGYPSGPDEADILAAAEAALEENYRRFPAPFQQRERTRLVALLRSWIEFERQRGPFEVVSLEADAELAVAGLTLSVRLDRLDRLNGKLLIIDYKTGRIRPRALASARLLEPQLPAYSVGREEVGAVLFAQVDEARPRLAGLADPDLDLKPAQLEPLPCASWVELEQRWRDQLHSLAEEFQRGQAAVAPAEAHTCEHCHLQSFCRIGQRQPAP